MLFDVYDECTGENYSRHWTRAAAQRAVDAFHAENEISIEGETPRAVAPVWQRWDWQRLRLVPSRERWPSGFSLNAGPGAPYAIDWTYRPRWYWRAADYIAALRGNPRGWRCAWCGRLNLHFDDCGWFVLAPHGVTDSRPACKRCHDGALGIAHRARHGVGER